jgi:putative transcriptional regulator
MRQPRGCGKSRAVEREENQKQVFLPSHYPWKSRTTRGIPTFPTAPTAAGISQTKSGILIVVDRKECLTPDSKKRTLRVTDVPPPPKPLTATQIRAIRQSFKVSQAVFARIINVSPNAVESWEQGVRHPREATLKLLTIAHKHPEILLSGE